MKKATIIGSGFTGCMFAMMLKSKNWDVTVIDKANFTGGGVRTFYHGGHPFTYGPRHFIGPEENIERLHPMYSTSVGDIVVDPEGNKHVVASLGFQEVV